MDVDPHDHTSLFVPERLADALDDVALGMLEDLVKRRDVDFVRAPSLSDVAHRTRKHEGESLAALARLVELGVVRVGIEVVPDVLWGYELGDPLRELSRNRKTARRSVRERVYRRDRSTCQNPFCRGTENKLGTDHVIPSSRGGSGREANLQVLCRNCDGRKGAMLPSDFVTLELLASLAPDSEQRESDLTTLRHRIREWLERPFRHQADVTARQEKT